MAALESGAVDALLIGIAPIGGGFDESWREDVRTALEDGCDVISGLHTLLGEDEEFARLAADNDCEIRDVRKPPADLAVSQGVASEVDAEVILTVGTDCSVGKMTTTMELARDARAAGHDAAVIPTGQTGIMIEGWGTPVDRVVSDFTAGAVEEMILEKGNDHDYLFVEGQGSIVHPAYSPVTLGILHGSMADSLVLCHEADREAIHGYESFSLPSIPPPTSISLTRASPNRSRQVGRRRCDKHRRSRTTRTPARRSRRTPTRSTRPATDVIRFGTDELLEELCSEMVLETAFERRSLPSSTPSGSPAGRRPRPTSSSFGSGTRPTTA